MKSFSSKNRRLIIFFSMLIAAVCLLRMGLALPTEAASQNSFAPTIVTIDSGTIEQGETFVAAITFTMPPPNMLQAVTLDVAYDPTILGYTNGSCTVNAPFLGVCNRSDGDGIPPDVISYSVVAVPDVGGTIELGDIPFIGSNLGTSDLTITVRTISDTNSEPPIITDGSVTVQETPTAVMMGQLSTEAVLNPATGFVLLGLLVVIVFTAVYIIWRKLQADG